jgi:hypothetical protein
LPVSKAKIIKLFAEFVIVDVDILLAILLIRDAPDTVFAGYQAGWISG